MINERQLIERAGFDAFFKGLNEDHCPYVEGCYNWAYWIDGYIAAESDHIRSEPSGIGAAYGKYMEVHGNE